MFVICERTALIDQRVRFKKFYTSREKHDTDILAQYLTA